MIKFKGSGVALVTPFNKDESVNYEKLGSLIDFHIKNGTDYIVVCGTTGESSTLSETEKKKIISFSTKKASGKIPIIAGTGTNNTSSTLSMSKYANECNADGVLVVTPYYNKCNAHGLFLHYKMIADAIYPTPVILYNVPSRTGVDIDIDTIISLAKIENIVGIKEANTSLEKIANTIFRLKELNLDSNFSIISGNDNLTIPILSLGGIGSISVCANIIPDVMHKICTDSDTTLYFKYLDLMNALFLDVNPIMIKVALNYLNFDVGPTRMPLCASQKDKISKLHKTIDKLF